MRKLLVLGAALAGLVCMPAVASAAAFDPNPDFPHDDSNSGSWSTPLIIDSTTSGLAEITFSSEGNGWDLAHRWGGQWVFDNGGFGCGGYDAVRGYLDTSELSVLVVTDVDTYGFPCFTAVDLPWRAEICEHGPSGDLWARMDMSVQKQGTGLAGEVFMRVDLDNGVVDGNWTTFNHQNSTTAETKLSTEWHLNGADDVYTEELYSNCAWPELQA